MPADIIVIAFAIAIKHQAHQADAEDQGQQHAAAQRDHGDRAHRRIAQRVPAINRDTGEADEEYQAGQEEGSPRAGAALPDNHAAESVRGMAGASRPPTRTGAASVAKPVASSVAI